MFQHLQEISFEVPTRRGTRTKTQLGAAWWGRQRRRPPPSCKDEEERAPRSNKRPRCPTFRRKEDSGMGVSLLSSGNETRPAATMEKPCISKPLTSPVLRFICPDTSTHIRVLDLLPEPLRSPKHTYLCHKPTRTHSRRVGYLHTFPHLSPSEMSLKEEFLLCGSNGLWVLHFQSVTAVSRHFSPALLPVFLLFLAVEKRTER